MLAAVLKYFESCFGTIPTQRAPVNIKLYTSHCTSPFPHLKYTYQVMLRCRRGVYDVLTLNTYIWYTHSYHNYIFTSLSLLSVYNCAFCSYDKNIYSLEIHFHLLRVKWFDFDFSWLAVRSCQWQVGERNYKALLYLIFALL